MKTIYTYFSIIAFMLLLLNACTVIKPGEVGVDIHWSKVQPKILQPGIHHCFGMGKKVVMFTTREVNYPFTIDFHTKEGIQAKTDLTILYHINPDSVISIYKRFGPEYANILLRDNIITAIRQIGLQYNATELIVARSEIEKSMMERLDQHIEPFGFVVHSVMLKQIDLPDDIQQTIEARIRAEQTAKKVKTENDISREQLNFEIEKSTKEKQLEISNQRLVLDFSIEKQKKENERMVLEAEAVKTQQNLINSTLTDQLLKLKMIQVNEALVKSASAKFIITDGKSPIILNNDKAFLNNN